MSLARRAGGNLLGSSRAAFCLGVWLGGGIPHVHGEGQGPSGAPFWVGTPGIGGPPAGTLTDAQRLPRGLFPRMATPAAQPCGARDFKAKCRPLLSFKDPALLDHEAPTCLPPSGPRQRRGGLSFQAGLQPPPASAAALTASVGLATSLVPVFSSSKVSPGSWILPQRRLRCSQCQGSLATALQLTWRCRKGSPLGHRVLGVPRASATPQPRGTERKRGGSGQRANPDRISAVLFQEGTLGLGGLALGEAQQHRGRWPLGAQRPDWWTPWRLGPVLVLSFFSAILTVARDTCFKNNQTGSSLVVQWVKDLMWSQLCQGFGPWPENFQMSQVQPISKYINKPTTSGDS